MLMGFLTCCESLINIKAGENIMLPLADYLYRVKTYFPYKRGELRDLLLCTILLSFIISFREWGIGVFDIGVGLENWGTSFLLVGFSLFIITAAQRLVGIYHGYQVEYRLWWMGILTGITLVFVSRGALWFLLPGGIMVNHLAGHRLGFHRYGMDYYILGLISYAGTLAAFLLALLVKISGTENEVLGKMVYFLVLFIIFDMLPVPPLTGIKLFYGSRLVYIFLLALTLVASFLMLTDIHPVLLAIISFIAAVVIWFVYYLGIERKIWRGPYGGGWAPKFKK